MNNMHKEFISLHGFLPYEAPQAAVADLTAESVICTSADSIEDMSLNEEFDNWQS